MVICIAIINTGCWSSHELDHSVFVSGVAIDKDGDKAELMVQTINIQKGSDSSDAGPSKNEAYKNISIETYSMFSGSRRLVHMLSRKLNFTHNEVLVITEDVAKGGVKKYIDFFARNPQNRRLIYVIISKDKPEKIFQIKTSPEIIPSLYLKRTCENMKNSSARASVVTLQEFLSDILTENKSAVAPFVEIREYKGEKQISIGGSGIFKGDKLVGQLNGTQTLGYLSCINKVSNSVLEVRCGKQEDEKISFEISVIKATIKPTVSKGGNLKIGVEIYVGANLVEKMCHNNMITDADVNMYKKIINSEIKRSVLSSFYVSKNLKCDIYGVGEVLRKKDYKKWEDIKSEWDEMFKNSKVTVKVNTKINSSGEIKDFQ